MWIEQTRTHDDGRPITTAIKLPEMDERVEFSSNGKAQVGAEVGELLVAEVSGIEANEQDEESEETEDTEEVSNERK